MVLKSKLKATHAQGLTVTAQQSRFHADAENSTAVKEIVVKDLNISVGQRDLLCNTELRLQPGRHYVLIGRNGVGKSSLLAAIATGHVPGIPRSTRILLLGQTRSSDDDETEQESRTDETVLQHVLRSDKRRERLLHEAKALSEATEHTDDPTVAVKVYREITHDRLERDIAEARQTAARRSGVRGLQARKELTRLEEELVRSSEGLRSLSLADSADDERIVTTPNELLEAYEMLASVQSELMLVDAPAAEAKARSVLIGLGFSSSSLEQSMSKLSGGWQTRCNLACALCQTADILLLDEPTNFLDLPSIIWFEHYIQNMDSSTTVVVVTHDRAFADSVGDELLILRDQKLETYRGSLSGYEVTRMKMYRHLSRMQDAQEKQRRHMQSSVDQNLKAAKRTGDDKKLKQAVSRKKKLDERMGMEVSAKGTRFKLNRDRPGWHENSRMAIELPSFDPPPSMSFPHVTADLRFPGALLSFENVTFSFEKSRNATPILRDISFTIHPGDRIGLVGLNGSGKSTLVSLAMENTTGLTDANSLMRGTITRHTRARFGLYTQQAVENLDITAIESPAATALTHLMESGGLEMLEKDARGLLSSLGLPGKVASDVPIALLSGGQKVRLALAKLLLNPPHLLILDEVTTHLDADTIAALALALRSFKGAILVVTHDRFFMRCVVEGDSPRRMAQQHALGPTGNDDEEANDEEDEDDSSDDDTGIVRQRIVYRLAKGKLIKMDGGMQQYEDRAEKASASLNNA